MNLRFQYLPYLRSFRQPLVTAHGEWSFREGFIIRLEDAEGSIGFGEMAPLPWFGTETAEQALGWCKAQSNELSGELSIPFDLPCVQFALTSALQQLAQEPIQRSFPLAALANTPSSFEEKQSAGYSTFKTKIGVESFEIEFRRIQDWISCLNPGQLLRLDANGGLSESQFVAWLEVLEGKPIEFIEQALPPGLENRMLELVEPFSTTLALDESVSGIDALNRWAHWPGPVVIKPSILGNPPESLPAGGIGSSVFETAFGLEACLQYLARNQVSDTAIGFDTESFFDEDGWSLHEAKPRLQTGVVSVEKLQALWEEKS